MTYCGRDSEEERSYGIFFKMCRKFGVKWVSADKEQRFIEEATGVTYERERTVRRFGSIMIHRTVLEYTPKVFTKWI